MSVGREEKWLFASAMSAITNKFVNEHKYYKALQFTGISQFSHFSVQSFLKYSMEVRNGIHVFLEEQL